MLGRNGLAGQSPGSRDEAMRLADLGWHQLFPPAAGLELRIAGVAPARSAPPPPARPAAGVGASARDDRSRASTPPARHRSRRAERGGPRRRPRPASFAQTGSPIASRRDRHWRRSRRRSRSTGRPRTRVDALRGAARAAIADRALHAPVESIVHHRLAEQADGHLPLRAVDQAARPRDAAPVSTRRSMRRRPARPRRGRGRRGSWSAARRRGSR